VALAAKGTRQDVDQRRLAGARGAGDADDMRLAGVRIQVGQQGAGSGAAVLDARDGACQGAAVTGQYLIG
jgi:hypothetical protein